VATRKRTLRVISRFADCRLAGETCKALWVMVSSLGWQKVRKGLLDGMVTSCGSDVQRQMGVERTCNASRTRPEEQKCVPSKHPHPMLYLSILQGEILILHVDLTVQQNDCWSKSRFSAALCLAADATSVSRHLQNTNSQLHWFRLVE